MIIGRISAKINNVKDDVYRFLYLQSNGAITKIVRCDLDLLFEGNKFETLLSLKQLAIAHKCMGQLL